jgi:predicted RNase H-like HicB family nuclease
LPKRGKGSHERWQHPLIGKTLTIPGKDGDDVPRYEREAVGNIVSRTRRVKGGRFMNRYSMIVQWSDEDQLFLVTIPEFAEGVVMPCTHGQTREEAIRHGEEVLEMYLEAWQEEGEPIPAPSILQIA